MPRLVRFVVRAVALCLAAVLLVIGGTAGSIWWVARQDDRPRSDAILVMGASQFDGRPSEIFEARLKHAKALFDAGVAPRIVTLGGGQPGDRTTEAASGEQYLEEQGVPSRNLLAIREGRDTLQSAQAASRVFQQRGWNSAVVVSDPWHSLRARRMLRDVGIAAEASPTRSGPAVRTRGTQLRYIARETAAYLYYRAFRRSVGDGPQAA
ncbi:MAG: YdcF family protein [Actinomycetota bacterium]|nr:YdcF family protein [Actinomycetota bacterium]